MAQSNVTKDDSPQKMIIRELKAVRKEIRAIAELLHTKADKSDRLISVKEAASIMHRSTDYVYDLIHAGRIGASRPTPTSRYILSENEVRRHAPTDNLN